MPAKQARADSSVRQRARAVLADLRSHASNRVRDELAPRYGIIAPSALGVPMAKIKLVAGTLGPDHALAEALWSTGVYEARLLASLVGEPDKLTPAAMGRWRKEFDNWSVCDTVCFNLFDRSPYALAMIDRWAGLRDEFGRRAAFALLACVALHRRDLPDDVFIDRLRLIEEAARDDRNFVKKAVSWALRAIGRRNARLHSAARSLADALAKSEQATARWVGKDALRGLKSG